MSFILLKHENNDVSIYNVDLYDIMWLQRSIYFYNDRTSNSSRMNIIIIELIIIENRHYTT